MVTFAETECCGWFHSVKKHWQHEPFFSQFFNPFLSQWNLHSKQYKNSRLCTYITHQPITSPSLCYAYCVVMVILYCIYQQPSTDLCPVYWHTHSNVDFCIILSIISSDISSVVCITHIWQLHISVQCLKYYDTATTM